MNAIRNPWDEATPEPLPETEAQLLAEVLDYAEMIARGEKQLDAVSMQKAAATEALYRSESWVQESQRIQPAREDAVGRPPVPNSRNRFVKWLNWRAKNEGKPAMGSQYTYRLIDAASYFAHGRNNYGWTERTYRPLLWLTKNGPRFGETFTDRIPEVEQIAIELAGSADKVTNSITRQAVAEFKKRNGWTGADTRRSRGEQKAKRKVDKVKDEFGAMLTESPAEAKEFLEWAYAKYMKLAGQADAA